MESIKLCCDYPKVLYKAFDEEQYALDFIQRGKIRLGSLEYYRRIESKSRRDPGEGYGSMRLPGIVEKVILDKDGNFLNMVEEQGYRDYQSSMANPIYILSCSAPPDDVDVRSILEESFGRFIVRINNPTQLGVDLLNALQSNQGRVHIEFTPVHYNKGEIIDNELMSRDERLDLSMRQKLRSYRRECEYRFMVLFYHPDNNDPDFVHIDLGAPLEYAELLV